MRRLVGPATFLVFAALLYGAFRFFAARGVHPTRVFGYGGAIFIGLAVLLVPLAIAERLSARRYECIERALVASRPDARVEAYAGPDGTGARVVSAAGEARLLRPVAGIGRAVLVAEDGARVLLARAEEIPPLAEPVVPLGPNRPMT